MSTAAVAEIGHNKPPLSPYEAVKSNMDDWLTEAHNWADGIEIGNQKQADAVEQLIEDLRLASVAAEEQRVIEKAPLDEQIAEIQDRYNVYIAPLKNKKPGKVPVAMEALRALLTPWKKKLEDERLAKVAAARKIADEAAAKAAEALKAAAPTDLGAREEAETLIQAAASAARVATRAENTKTTGLRDVWKPVMLDRKAALVHYAATNPDALVGFLQGLAEADVRGGKRQIPGFEVQRDQVAR